MGGVGQERVGIGTEGNAIHGRMGLMGFGREGGIGNVAGGNKHNKQHKATMKGTEIYKI